jgi:hypothetical protein
MRSNNTQRIVKEIAREYGYAEKEISDIIKLQYEFLANIMRKANRENLEFPSVRIKYFATFYCSEDRKKYFEKVKLKVDARRERNLGTRAAIIPVYPTTDGCTDL